MREQTYSFIYYLISYVISLYQFDYLYTRKDFKSSGIESLYEK